MFGNSYGSTYGEINRQVGEITVLEISDANIGLTSTSPALTQITILSVNNAQVGFMSDSVALSALQSLSVANASISVTSTTPSFTQSELLHPDNAEIGVESDEVQVSQELVVTPHDAFIGFSADVLVKIIDWDKMSVGFGSYRPKDANSGSLSQKGYDTDGAYRNAYGVSARIHASRRTLLETEELFLFLSEKDSNILEAEKYDNAQDQYKERYKIEGIL